MKLFNFKKNKRSVTNADGFTNLLFNSQGSYSTNRALLLSAVYRCVEVISDSIAQLPLEPYFKSNDGFKSKFTAHPSYALLNKEPNNNMTRYTFIKTLATSMLLTGNAYAYIDRDGKGNAKALYYVPTDIVTIIYPQKLNEQVKYSIAGFSNVVEACNMIHILNFTRNGIEGISTLSYAKQALALSDYAEQNAKGFFEGGANLSGIIKTEKPLTTERKQELKQSWQQAFAPGVGTPGGVTVLDCGANYQPITVNPTDAQLLETRRFNVVDICRFFGVSPVKAFDLSNSSYSTVEATQLAFLTDTLSPLLEKFEQEFERKLYKPSEKANIEVRFDTTPILRVNKSELAQYFSTLFQIGALTVNDIRKELDLTALDGGDTSLVQVNLQTLQNASAQKSDEIQTAQPSQKEEETNSEKGE